MTSTNQTQLIGHWELTENAFDRSGQTLHSLARELVFQEVEGRQAALFQGKKSGLEVTDHPALHLGEEDFSISFQIHTKSGREGGDVIGDVISKFDTDARKGFNLVLSTQTGTTVTTQPNYRQLQFGVDDAYVDEGWADCGQPGNAVKIAALATVNGHLYASTTELGADEAGHVWRYEGGNRWADMGVPPIACNSVESLTYFEGTLVAASGRYNPRGSQLGAPKNVQPGGMVYRITSDGEWIGMGHPGKEGAAPDNPDTQTGETNQADETNCLTVFRGNLYATSHHRRGLFRYEGGKDWKLVGPDFRIMSVTVYEGNLYVLCNGENGGMYRYESEGNWTWCGDPPCSTQTYCAVTHRGRLLVGTWPECEIVEYLGGTSWGLVGRVGYEREVMATSLYNGKCYFGTLPMANIFRMDKDRFTFFGNVDNHPDYHLRRAWSMAVYRGRLFVGTLPQGKVMSRRAGAVATNDHPFPAGWRHVVAMRKGKELLLYVDGKEVGRSDIPASMNLSNATPLQIGGAAIGHAFNGALRDMRIYRGALDARTIQSLGGL